MVDEYLAQLEQEQQALLDLVHSRPTEDWARELERIGELGARIREHKEMMRG